MKKNWKLYSIITIVVAISIVAIIILFNLMQGQTITINNTIDPTEYSSLNCTTDDIDYPMFTNNKSQSKTLTIDLIFTGDILKTIALNYTLYYSDKNIIQASEAQNHAAMNLSFYSSGFDSDEFNAKYTKTSNSLRMNLYTQSTNINQASAKYFLINIDENNNTPKTISEYEENYTRQGFNCKKQVI